jgi:hypothetical protein
MKLFQILAASAALFLTSCSTFQVDGGNDLAAPVAAVATAALLSETDKEDRAEVAEKMLRVATVIEDAFSEEGVTGEDVAALITEVIGDEAEFGGYSVAIGLIFDRYKVKLGEGQTAVIIRDIASGIRQVAQTYL